MPTSYTSLIGLALPVTGELSGTWGDVVNNYITNYLDSAVAGTQTISGTQTAVTLSVTNGSSLVTAGSGATGSAQFQIINCTGNPAGLLTITAPASSRQYIIINATSTSQSVKIVGTGPTTGVTLIAGEKAHVAWNGSDFVKIATTAAAGGSNTQVQYNSSGVLAGSSNLTFDGTNLTVGGTASATKLIPTGGAATGNGMYLPAANTLAWSNNGSETMRLDSSGNLGLGATPAYRLDVSGGHARIRGAQALFWGNSDNTNFVSIYNGGSSGASTGQMIFETNGTEKMRLDSSGNLGIGNTSPSSYDAAARNLVVGTTSGNNGITISSGTTSTGYLAFARGTTGADPYRGFVGYNHASDFMTFATNGSERARIDSSGKLLINATTSPSAATVKAAIQGAAGADSYYQFGNGSGGGGLIGSVVSGGIQMYTYTGAFGSETYTERMRIDSSGNLGIGTTSPDANGRLTVDRSGSNYIMIRASGTNKLSLYADASASVVDAQANYLAFNAGSAERARITSGGNLLVGTTGSGSLNGRVAVAGTSGNASIGTLSGSGTGALDTGISINQVSGGACIVLVASRNVSAGTNTDAAVYIVRFYYDGNNAPTTVYVGGSSNFVTFGTSGSNTLTLANAGGGNVNYSWFGNK